MSQHIHDYNIMDKNNKIAVAFNWKCTGRGHISSGNVQMLLEVFIALAHGTVWSKWAAYTYLKCNHSGLYGIPSDQMGVLWMGMELSHTLRALVC